MVGLNKVEIIGSGTRLAMKDAIALCRDLQQSDSLDSALAQLQRLRKLLAIKIAAANSSAR